MSNIVLVNLRPLSRVSSYGSYSLQKNLPRPLHDPEAPPTQYSMSAKLAPNSRLDHFCRNSGGADRDRTGGLLVANQALSQLSYSPINTGFKVARFQSFKDNHAETLPLCHLETLILVGLGRVELPTSPLSGVRSSHLSYRPIR